jgi:hypothetical protein
MSFRAGFRRLTMLRDLSIISKRNRTMHRSRARITATYLFALIAAPLVLACSGTETISGTDGDNGGNQTASAVATPSSATIAHGGTTSTTVVYSASNSLTIGSSFSIQRQYSGISVTQTSTQQSGNTITKVYTIGADNTVPAGTHLISFSTPVTGYAGNGTAPTAFVQFSLTVTQ